MISALKRALGYARWMRFLGGPETENTRRQRNKPAQEPSGPTCFANETNEHPAQHQRLLSQIGCFVQRAAKV